MKITVLPERTPKVKSPASVPEGVDVANTAVRATVVGGGVLALSIAGAVAAVAMLASGPPNPDGDGYYSEMNFEDLQGELDYHQDELAFQQTRLSAVSDANADGRILDVATRGLLLDRLLPFAPAGAPIERFEVELTAILAEYGLEGVDVRRGSLADAEAPGTKSVPVEITVRGDRDRLIAWLASIDQLPRLITTDYIQLSIGEQNQVSTIVTLRLWYATDPNLRSKLEQAGGERLLTQLQGVAPPVETFLTRVEFVELVNEPEPTESEQP